MEKSCMVGIHVEDRDLLNFAEGLGCKVER